jgi:DNA-binding transcriptional MerR regulator
VLRPLYLAVVVLLMRKWLCEQPSQNLPVMPVRSETGRMLLGALLLTFQSVEGVSFHPQIGEGGTAMERLLTIGQLAHATSVPAKTIRYYEQVGVLPAPRRSATGYRQYTQRDVHRLLFIRRARALGLSLSSITALTVDLADGSCLAIRPRLTHLVTEHLRTVRQQITELQLLERQLTQVLRRLLTRPPSPHADGCQCLADEAPAVPETHPLSPPLTFGGHDMDTAQTLESLTRLTTTPQGRCGCGCGCDDGLSFTQLMPLQLRSEPASAEDEDASRNAGCGGKPCGGKAP